MESGDYLLAGKTAEWDEGSTCLSIELQDASAKGILIKEDVAQSAYSFEIQSSAGSTIFGVKGGTITGTVQAFGSTVTTGIILDLQASALTTGKGLDMSDLAAITTGKGIHVDATGVTQTDGILVHIDSASTALTSTGRLLLVDHTGNAGVSTILSEFKSAATDETIIVKVTATSTLLSGVMLDLSGAALTTGKVIDISDLDAITTGKAIHVDATGVTQTSGILVHIDSACTVMDSTGRLFLVDHTGTTTTSGITAEFKSAATDETVILKVTATSTLLSGVMLDLSGAALTTGKVVDISDLDAITTGKAIHVDATGVTQTSGILVHIDSACTVMDSTGRLLLVDHTGVTTVSGIVAEVKSAANDETVVLKVTASDILALGSVLKVSGAAVTTGTILDCTDADGLTTGTLANFKSNSSDTGTRTLVNIHNDHASATGVTPLKITQDNVTSTNFKLMMTLGTISIYVSDQTSPNAALTAIEGSICLNGSATGQAFWNTDGGTSWTALA